MVSAVKRNIDLITGIVLLVAAITLYLYIGLMILSQYNLLDDSVSWFHKHVLDYISTGNRLDWDFNLRLIDGRNLYRSPILLDMFIHGLGIPIQQFVLFNGVVGVILVYLVALTLYRSHIVSGIASILFALSPVFIYWFKPVNYGSYTIHVWWLISIILLSYGVRKRSPILITTSSLIYLILWFLWSAGWILYVVYSILLAGMIYAGMINRDVLLGGLILLISLPLNLLLNLEYITIYHIIAYTMLLTYLVVGFIEYRIMGAIGRLGRNAWRLIGSFTGFAIALSIMAILNSTTTLPGIPEYYTKSIDPILDYGVFTILLLFSVLLILRSGIYRSILEYPGVIIVVIGVIVGVVASYVEAPISVFTSSLAAILVAFGLKHVFTVLYYNTRGSLRIMYTVVALFIIAGSIAANGVVSLYYANLEPAITYGDLPKELVGGKLNITAFKYALDTIENMSSGRNILVISYWGFSYWITGYLGENTYVAADPQGSGFGWRYLSKIYLSTDEYRVLGLISELKKKIPGDTDVYVIVTSVISVEVTGIEAAGANAHLGYPIVLPGAAGQQTQVIYRAVGDTARFPLYIYTLGEKTDKYLDFGRAQYVVQAPLSWSDTGSKTLLARLVTNAVKALNYTVINDVYSPIPLDVEELKYFKPVRVIEAPFKIVDTGTMKLRVEYIVALYKVEF